MAEKPQKPSYFKYKAETIYVGEYIDLKKVQEGIRQYTYLNRDHPLVIRLLKDEYVVLTKFGAVTFWNVPGKLRKEFLLELTPFVKSRKERYHYDEETAVLVGGDEGRVTFDEIYVTSLDVNNIKIISYVLSQSVALERYEEEIEGSLSEVGVVIENLKSTGRALLTQKEMLKQIGKVFSVKQIAVAHLSLFDKPEEIWESPELDNLYNKMSAEYDLRVRFDVLDEKIGYLSDVSQMLINFLAEKQNAFLEVIIIVLIVIEIALWFLPPFSDILKYFMK